MYNIGQFQENRKKVDYSNNDNDGGGGGGGENSNGVLKSVWQDTTIVGINVFNLKIRSLNDLVKNFDLSVRLKRKNKLQFVKEIVSALRPRIIGGEIRAEDFKSAIYMLEKKEREAKQNARCKIKPVTLELDIQSGTRKRRRVIASMEKSVRGFKKIVLNRSSSMEEPGMLLSEAPSEPPLSLAASSPPLPSIHASRLSTPQDLHRFHSYDASCTTTSLESYPSEKIENAAKRTGDSGFPISDSISCSSLPLMHFLPEFKREKCLKGCLEWAVEPQYTDHGDRQGKTRYSANEYGTGREPCFASLQSRYELRNFRTVHMSSLERFSPFIIYTLETEPLPSFPQEKSDTRSRSDTSTPFYVSHRCDNLPEDVVRALQARKMPPPPVLLTSLCHGGPSACSGRFKPKAVGTEMDENGDEVFCLYATCCPRDEPSIVAQNPANSIPTHDSSVEGAATFAAPLLYYGIQYDAGDIFWFQVPTHTLVILPRNAGSDENLSPASFTVHAQYTQRPSLQSLTFLTARVSTFGTLVQEMRHLIDRSHRGVALLHGFEETPLADVASIDTCRAPPETITGDTREWDYADVTKRWRIYDPAGGFAKDATSFYITASKAFFGKSIYFPSRICASRGASCFPLTFCKEQDSIPESALNASNELQIPSFCVNLRGTSSYHRGRISVPVRGPACTHIACFDAPAFLRQNARINAWVCPICRKEAFPESLVVDTYFAAILKCAPADAIGFRVYNYLSCKLFPPPFPLYALVYIY